jgi:hypothetical protein
VNTLLEYVTANECAEKNRKEKQKKKVARLKGKPKVKQIL